MQVTKRDFLRYTSSSLALLATIGIAGRVGAQGEIGTMANKNLIIRKAEQLSEADIYAWLIELRGNPFVEQSSFDVTSIFKVKSGKDTYYVGGVNVENTELTVGTCGEEGAIAAAVGALGREVDIIEGWVMGAPRGAENNKEIPNVPCYPCGECRQRIAQYTSPEAPIHMVGLDGTILDTQTRGQLLPNAFSFRDLEHVASAVVPPALVPVKKVEDRLFREPSRDLNDAEIFAWMQGLQPDVRVSEFAETVVLKLDNGAYVAGVKVENAAYPSSTSAMQAAAAILNARYGYAKVQEVWSFGRENNPEKAANIRDIHMPMSGASLQVLGQFAENANVQVNVFNAKGAIIPLTLQKSLHRSRTFENLYPEARNPTRFATSQETPKGGGRSI